MSSCHASLVAFVEATSACCWRCFETPSPGPTSRTPRGWRCAERARAAGAVQLGCKTRGPPIGCRVWRQGAELSEVFLAGLPHEERLEELEGALRQALQAERHAS